MLVTVRAWQKKNNSQCTMMAVVSKRTVLCYPQFEHFLARLELCDDALDVAGAGANLPGDFQDAKALLAQADNRSALFGVIVPRATERLAFGFGPGEPGVDA